MKRIVFMLAINAAILSSCGRSMMGGGEVTGARSVAVNEPPPYGMVLVKRGSFEMGPADKDSLWGMVPDTKGVSFDAFWMDQTEVTNAQYRQFVYWVRDSIIRERLADPQYGGNDLFKITEDRFGEAVTPHLNWNRPIPWRRPTEDEEKAIESVYYTNPVTGEKKLDPKQMVFKYEWYDYTAAALRKNRLNPADRVRNTDIAIDPNEVVMISKDTAYVNDEGLIINETITRPLSSEWDFLHTRIINIYPDETCWINDFNNAYNEPYVRMYFQHPGYDDYPVVGVSWEQSIAFCEWRTFFYKSSHNLPNGITIEPFRLPTEGEWEYAARTGKNEYKYPWATDGLQSNDCFLGNFKPGNGNYTEDGHLIPAKVASFAPNEFGLYDMAGNVAEWTVTVYSESGPRQMNDMNPDLRYNAAKEDPYAMKKKVVRGGSWKDVHQFIRSDMRTFEYQNETRSYIGFRCVRTQIGFSRSKGGKK
jgi:formylglycine-generating enzyme required for sulfatase activity